MTGPRRASADLTVIADALSKLLAQSAEQARELRALRLLIEARAEGPLASDSDVDGERGDPKVRFDPKGWRGESCRGRKMSACPPAFLDELARALTSMAANEDAEKKMWRGKPESIQTRRDAARARRWAYRLRTGWTAPSVPATANGAGSGPTSAAEAFTKANVFDAAPGLDPFDRAHGDAWEPTDDAPEQPDRF